MSRSWKNSYIKEQGNTFKRFETSIKEIGTLSPFLFGEPSSQILWVLCKLYHENIIRVLNDYNLSLKFMIGILQTDDGELYCTLAGDPYEIADYGERYKLFISLLEAANIRVSYPDKDVAPDPIEWREKIMPREFDRLRSYIFAHESDEIKQVGNIKNALKSVDYDEILRSTSMTMHFVNSNAYLQQRRRGESFAPFKRIDATGELNCAYGSACVEAKLFSYMYSIGKHMKNVKGFVAYWIGNALPPNHMNSKYSYNSSLPTGLVYINSVKDVCIRNMDVDLMRRLKIYPAFDTIVKNIALPISLPCAGCVANYSNYIHNKYNVWDSSMCGKRLVGGGCISRRRRNRRHKKYTKKHKIAN